jgi:hypothetical protein
MKYGRMIIMLWVWVKVFYDEVIMDEISRELNSGGNDMEL